jgi:uncharacterized protein (TIGR00251 family)
LAWYRKEAGALVVAVRLTPRADRDVIDGITTLSDGRVALKARVRAVPEDGAANIALVALMAKSLRVPKSAVDVASGQAQRLKQIRISGDADDLARRLAGLVKS